MQIKIKDNYKDFIKTLDRKSKKQLPFASMKAINKIGPTLKLHYKLKTRKAFDRPTPFTQNAFHFFKASMKKPVGTLFIKDAQEEYLKWQIDGGVRSTGRKIPIPYLKNARLNKYGNIIGKRSGLIKKKSQFISKVKGVSGVFERTKQGVKLIYMFHDDVNYESRFPFYKIGRAYIDRHFKRMFKQEITKALRKP
jgi:hypothetical protein